MNSGMHFGCLNRNSTNFIHTIHRFNVFSEPTTSHMSISSPKVSTTSTKLKYEVWKYYDKVTVNEVRRAQYKLCPEVHMLSPKMPEPIH